MYKNNITAVKIQKECSRPRLAGFILNLVKQDCDLTLIIEAALMAHIKAYCIEL